MASCKKCAKPVAELDYQFSCCACRGIYHHKCLGMTDKLYAEAKKLSQYFAFVCTSCKSNGLFQSPPATASTAEIVAQVMKELIPYLDEFLQNALEKREKKNNLVVFGMQESDDNDNSDLNVVRDLCTKVGVAHNDVREVFRSGTTRDDGKPRILKVRFSGLKPKGVFLKKFNGVKESVASCQRAWVRPDLTTKEREHDRKLREQLRIVRSAGRNAKIYRGRIVYFDDGGFNATATDDDRGGFYPTVNSVGDFAYGGNPSINGDRHTRQQSVVIPVNSEN